MSRGLSGMADKTKHDNKQAMGENCMRRLRSHGLYDFDLLKVICGARATLSIALGVVSREQKPAQHAIDSIRLRSSPRDQEQGQ